MVSNLDRSTIARFAGSKQSMCVETATLLLIVRGITKNSIGGFTKTSAK